MLFYYSNRQLNKNTISTKYYHPQQQLKSTLIQMTDVQSEVPYMKFTTIHVLLHYLTNVIQCFTYWKKQVSSTYVLNQPILSWKGKNQLPIVHPCPQFGCRRF